MSETPSAFESSTHEALRKVEDASFWFQHRNRIVAELLRRFPVAGTFADVGGGNGCVAEHLARLGHEVVVVEPGTGGCAHARARGLRVHQCTIEQSPFGPGSLGAVGAFDVVEHIPDAGKFLNECRTPLRPDGRLFVTVPAYPWLWSGADTEAGHVCRYTIKTLRALVEASGFQIEYASYLFMVCVPPLALSRALPYWLGQRRPIVGRLAQDHVPGGATQRLIERFLAREVAAISQDRRIPFGTSVVAVAQRRV